MKLLKLIASVIRDIKDSLLAVSNPQTYLAMLEERAIQAKDWTRPFRVETPIFDGHADIYFDMLPAEPTMTVYIFRNDDGHERMSIAKRSRTIRTSNPWLALSLVQAELRVLGAEKLQGALHDRLERLKKYA